MRKFTTKIIYKIFSHKQQNPETNLARGVFDAFLFTKEPFSVPAPARCLGAGWGVVVIRSSLRVQYRS